MPAPAAPDILARWMAPFEALFTRPTWRKVLVLAAGSLFAPGRRTVTSALGSRGRREAATFTNFHRVLTRRSRGSSQAGARRLLALLVAAFAPDSPVVIGIDEQGSRMKDYSPLCGPARKKPRPEKPRFCRRCSIGRSRFPPEIRNQ